MEADTVKAVWFPFSPALALLLLIATVWKYCDLLKKEKWENTDGTAPFFLFYLPNRLILETLVCLFGRLAPHYVVT